MQPVCLTEASGTSSEIGSLTSGQRSRLGFLAVAETKFVTGRPKYGRGGKCEGPAGFPTSPPDCPTRSARGALPRYSISLAVKRPEPPETLRSERTVPERW